jgi:hypothetical protein
MAKSKKDKSVLAYRLIVTVVVVLVVGVFGIAYWSQKPRAQAPTDDAKVVALAECLTSKGLKMYGTYWCPHCKDQKKEFGSAWSKINYIECSEQGNPRSQLKVCADAGIEGYPTWVTPDGSKLTGPQTFKALADKAGCDWTE